MARRDPWRTRVGQTVFDLSVQLYGDFEEGLPKIIAQVDTLDDPDAGTEILTETTTDRLANTLFSTNIVATAQPPDEETGEGIGFMIIADTFIIS